MIVQKRYRESGPGRRKQTPRPWFSGILMKYRKRLQAYPIACGPILTAPGGWASWYGWLDSRDYKNRLGSGRNYVSQ